MCFWQLCLMSVLCVCGINVFQKILEQNRIFMEIFVITGNKNLWISGCCLRSLFVIYASQKQQANHFYCYCYYFLIVKCKPQKAPSNSRTITGRKCCAVFFVLFFHDHCFFCLFVYSCILLFAKALWWKMFFTGNFFCQKHFLDSLPATKWRANFRKVQYFCSCWILKLSLRFVNDSE